MRELCHKKTFFICLSLLFCSLFCLLFSSPVSALELTGGNALVLDSGTIVTDVQTRNATKSHSDLIFDFPGTESFVYGLSFDYSSTTIPSTNYLLSFDVTYISSLGSAGGSNYTGHFRYDGLESQTMSKVFESCVDNHNTPITNGGITQYIGEGQVTCSYIFFSHSGTYNSFTSRNDSRIWFGISATNNRIIVSPGFVRGISWNGLTQEDRDWLESVMPAGTSTSDIESAIESSREDEKQEIQDAADDAQDSADEYGDQAAQQGESLISVVSSFVTGLTQVQPSNCVIDVDLSLYRGGSHNNVDLCPMPKNSYINTILVTVSGIIMAVWVVRAVVTVIQVMISMYREYQS